MGFKEGNFPPVDPATFMDKRFSSVCVTCPRTGWITASVRRRWSTPSTS